MAENTKLSFGAKVKKFFKDYKTEFKKIKWPTLRETNKSFMLVLVAVVVVGLAVFGLDTGLNQLITLLANLVG